MKPNFIKTTILAGLLAGATLIQTAQAGDLSKNFQVIDLTHEMHDGMVFWPGGVPFKATRLVDYNNGYRLHKFEMGENTGTHVDAPSHFIKGKNSIADIPVSDWVAPVVVIDVSAQVAKNPSYEITPSDITKWESKHGKIPAGSVFLAHTGWSEKFTDNKAYVNFDSNKVMQFPGYAPATAKILIDRKIKGVGIDTLSLDHGPSKTFAFHTAILKNNIYQIENLNNISKLPATGADIVIGVLPVRDGSQAQARILGFVKK